MQPHTIVALVFLPGVMIMSLSFANMICTFTDPHGMACKHLGACDASGVCATLRTIQGFAQVGAELRSTFRNLWKTYIEVAQLPQSYQCVKNYLSPLAAQGDRKSVAALQEVTALESSSLSLSIRTKEQLEDIADALIPSVRDAMQSIRHQSEDVNGAALQVASKQAPQTELEQQIVEFRNHALQQTGAIVSSILVAITNLDQLTSGYSLYIQKFHLYISHARDELLPHYHTYSHQKAVPTYLAQTGVAVCAIAPVAAAYLAWLPVAALPLVGASAACLAAEYIGISYLEENAQKLGQLMELVSVEIRPFLHAMSTQLDALVSTKDALRLLVRSLNSSKHDIDKVNGAVLGAYGINWLRHISEALLKVELGFDAIQHEILQDQLAYIRDHQHAQQSSKDKLHQCNLLQ